LDYRFTKFATRCLLSLWLLIELLTTYLLTFGVADFSFDVLINFGIVIGIPAVWSLYDYTNPKRIAKYSPVFGYSFMIFVFHEPLLTILKKGLFFLTGKTNLSFLLIYLVAPLLSICICMWVRIILLKGTPRFYSFTTGGR